MDVINYTVVDEHGLVRSYGQTAEPQLLSAPAGGRVLAGVAPLTVNAWWEQGSQTFQLIPPAPSPRHTFDPLAKVWALVLTLADLRAEQLNAVNAAFERASQALTEGYPASERLTWPIQQAEALAWAADPAAPTPYLDGLAAARGIEPAELRQKTLDNVQAWMAASQQLIGRRQQLRDAIAAAATEDDIRAITWEGDA